MLAPNSLWSWICTSHLLPPVCTWWETSSTSSSWSLILVYEHHKWLAGVFYARARTLVHVSDKSAFFREIKSKELGSPNPLSHLRQPGYSLLTFKTCPYWKTLFKCIKLITFSCFFCACRTFYYVTTNESQAFPYSWCFCWKKQKAEF